VRAGHGPMHRLKDRAWDPLASDLRFPDLWFLLCALLVDREEYLIELDGKLRRRD
jgi:hypothetical protein